MILDMYRCNLSFSRILLLFVIGPFCAATHIAADHEESADVYYPEHGYRMFGGTGIIPTWSISAEGNYDLNMLDFHWNGSSMPRASTALFPVKIKATVRKMLCSEVDDYYQSFNDQLLSREEIKEIDGRIEKLDKIALKQWEEVKSKRLKYFGCLSLGAFWEATFIADDFVQQLTRVREEYFNTPSKGADPIEVGVVGGTLSAGFMINIVSVPKLFVYMKISMGLVWMDILQTKVDSSLSLTNETARWQQLSPMINPVTFGYEYFLLDNLSIYGGVALNIDGYITCIAFYKSNRSHNTDWAITRYNLLFGGVRLYF